VRSRDSFSNLTRWLADARALASPNLVVVLVGNKSDCEEEREVEWAEASRWAAENGLWGLCSITSCWTHSHQDVHFLETSSLSGENVEAPFLLVARAILLAIESGTLDPEKTGSGVSYGDRALRRVNSSSRLSFGSFTASRRKGGSKSRIKDWVPGSTCC
jgi:GTPase SAR1 family protein